MPPGIVDTGYTQALGSGLGLAQNFMQMAMSARQQNIENERQAKLDDERRLQLSEENRRADIMMGINQAQAQRVQQEYEQEQARKKAMTPFLREMAKNRLGLSQGGAKQAPAQGLPMEQASTPELASNKAFVQIDPNAPQSLPEPNVDITTAKPADMSAFLRQDAGLAPWQQKAHLAIDTSDYDSLIALIPLLEKEQDVERTKAMFQALSEGKLSAEHVSDPYKQTAMWYAKQGNFAEAAKIMEKGMAEQLAAKSEAEKRATMRVETAEVRKGQAGRMAKILEGMNISAADKIRILAAIEDPELAAPISGASALQQREIYRQHLADQLSGKSTDISDVPVEALPGLLEQKKSEDMRNSLRKALVEVGYSPQEAAIMSMSSEGGRLPSGVTTKLLGDRASQAQLQSLDKELKMLNDRVLLLGSSIKSKKVVGGMPVVTLEMRKEAADDPSSQTAAYVQSYDQLKDVERRRQSLMDQMSMGLGSNKEDGVDRLEQIMREAMDKSAN